MNQDQLIPKQPRPERREVPPLTMNQAWELGSLCTIKQLPMGAPVRLLDPCCKDGDAVNEFRSSLMDNRRYATSRSKNASNVDNDPDCRILTFGAEADSDQAANATQLLDAVLNSELFGTAISHRAFSAILLHLPNTDAMRPSKNPEETAGRVLDRVSPYLVPEGLLILTTPQHRLPEVELSLSTHYDSIEAWTMPEEPSVLRRRETKLQAARENNDADALAELTAEAESPLLVVFGYRRDGYERDRGQQQLIRNWAAFRPPELKELRRAPLTSRDYMAVDDEHRHRIPHVAEQQLVFTSRQINPVQAVQEARKVGLWKHWEIAELLSDPEEFRVRSLTPPRRGHMAWMAAAGHLDNLCLEATPDQSALDPDQPTPLPDRVLIKGQTRKETVSIRESDDRTVHQERLRTTLTALNLETGVIEYVG